MDTTGTVLQYLSREGVAGTETIADDTNIPDTELMETMNDLESDGYVEGDGFWYLTDEGESYFNDVLRARFTSDQIAELEDCYQEFESLDSRFKELANSWQRRDDERARDELIGDLTEFHREVEAFLDGFSEPIRAEYQTYVNELESALETLRGGDDDYFTGTDVDSYHTIWFRWHDDLLRTLGKQRDE